MTKKVISMYKKLAFYVALFLIVAVSFLSLYIDNRIVYSVVSNYEEQVEQQLESGAEFIRSNIAEFEHQIRYLRHTSAIADFTNTFQASSQNNPEYNQLNDEAINQVAITFSAFMSEYTSIDQARLLDNRNGMELVRINRKQTQVVRVSEQALQNKSTRNYFSETDKIDDDTIYLSNINLNRENGDIQYPLKPTFRLAAQLFNQNGEKVAILVLNINAINMLNTLAQRAPNEFSLYLLNEEQQFLIHPEAGVAFSHEFTQNRTWNDMYRSTAASQASFLRARYLSNSESDFWYKEQNLSIGQNEWSRPLQLIIGIDNAIIRAEITNNRINAFSLVAFLLLAVILGGLFFKQYIRRTILLARAQAEHSAIINSTSEAIVSVDSQGIINTWNKAAEDLFMCSNSDAVGQAIGQVIKLPFINFSEEIKQFTLHNIKQNKRFTTDYEKEQKHFNLEVILSNIQSGTSSSEGVAIVIRNITEDVEIRKQIELSNENLENEVSKRTEELEAAKNQAEQANILKSAFISSISHEMRTPLNGILGTLQLISKEPLTSLQLSYLSMTQTSIGSLNALINDILDLSKIEAGKMSLNKKPFDLLSEFENAITPIVIKAQDKGLKVYVDVSELAFSQLYGDKHRITQLFNNLLSNAEKFTSHGEISIQLSTRVASASEPNKIQLRCCVADTGIGIDEANQDQLFKAFVQEDSTISSQFGGTGLGLSISKQLSILMDGDVWFTSAKGKGSQFCFDVLLEKNIKAKRTNEAQAKKCKVYVRLKDVKEHEIVCKTLSANAYEVSAEFNDDIDLIIIDDDIEHQISSSIKAHQQIVTLHTPAKGEVINNTLLNNGRACVNRPFSIAKLELSTANAAQAETNNEVQSLHSLTSNYSHLSTKSVLIVDDNDINIEVMKGLLGDIVGQAFVCKNGKETIDLLKRVSKSSKRLIDIILLDCNMPIMDGFECASLIRKGEAGSVYTHIPIIAVTADAMLGDEERCLAAGMDDYFTKPINVAELLSKLQKYQ